MSSITYELHIPPVNEQAILDSLRGSGYSPVNDWVENRNYIYAYSVEQPSDFYILVHNLLRQGRIVLCTARVEEPLLGHACDIEDQQVQTRLLTLAERRNREDRETAEFYRRMAEAQ